MFNIQNKLGLNLAIALFLAWPNTYPINVANAQSFSCANAQIPSEMAVCNNEELLMKDETVADLLASQLVDATQSGRLSLISYEHSQWLKDRNACKGDMSCLGRQYDLRIKALSKRDL